MYLEYDLYLFACCIYSTFNTRHKTEKDKNWTQIWDEMLQSQDTVHCKVYKVNNTSSLNDLKNL